MFLLLQPHLCTKATSNQLTLHPDALDEMETWAHGSSAYNIPTALRTQTKFLSMK